MAQQIQFTDDELDRLHLLLSQEIEVTRVELHHTATLRYREYIKERLAEEVALLKKMEEMRPDLKGA